MNDLTLEGLLKGHRMITDDTRIIIQDLRHHVVADGNWFDDNALNLADNPISCLSYYAITDRLHIILK